jgi:NAD-dependent oxidoreductase involved in siderophore biosynthesis
MRELYIAGNDLLIYTAVRNFFKAVHEVFWCIQDDPGFIRKTVGIQALFSILKLLCSKAISEKDISVAFFKKALAPAAGIDFNDRFFHASGAGKTRIRNTLCVALSLRELDDLSDKDRAEYIRILKAINGDA